MVERSPADSSRVMLSFHGAYETLALRLGRDLTAARVEVRYDKWEGGGAEPPSPCVASSLDHVAFVVVLLSPAIVGNLAGGGERAEPWVGAAWHRAVFDEARRRGIAVLPVRGERCAAPDFLAELSYADLAGRNYQPELRRLVQRLRKLSGDPRIELPAGDDDEAPSLLAALTDVTPIVLEVGTDLVPLLERDGRQDWFVKEMVPMMRDGLFYELGVPFPGLDIRRASSEIPAESARILMHGIPEKLVSPRLGHVLVSASVEEMRERGINAEPGTQAATGEAAAWIPTAAASALPGQLTWDPASFLVLELSALLRRKAANFIGIGETRGMIQRIEEVFPHLVAETVPATVPWFTLADVLRRLVAEEISIRDLRAILMALVEWGRFERDPSHLAEYVRAALNRAITHKFTRGSNTLLVFLLDPNLEERIRGAVRYTAWAAHLDLEPEVAQRIVAEIRQAVAALPPRVHLPVILTKPEIRTFVRRLVAHSLQRIHVLSYYELNPRVQIQPLTRIGLDGTSVWREFTIA